MNQGITEQQVRAIFRDELKKLFGFNSNPDIEYLPINQAYLKLGYKNVRALRYAIDSGVLRVGKEVQDRRSSDSTRPDYYFNIQACINRLNTPPEKRSS